MELRINPVVNFAERNNCFFPCLKGPKTQIFIKGLQGIVGLALVGIAIAATTGAFSNASLALGSSVVSLSAIFCLTHFFRDDLRDNKPSVVIISLLSIGCIAIAGGFLTGGLLTTVSVGRRMLAIIFIGVGYFLFMRKWTNAIELFVD
ncbi:MAG: hypothetical protein R3E91_05675 [Chlamydiales bacterium]